MFTPRILFTNNAHRRNGQQVHVRILLEAKDYPTIHTMYTLEYPCSINRTIHCPDPDSAFYPVDFSFITLYSITAKEIILPYLLFSRFSQDTAKTWHDNYNSSMRAAASHTLRAPTN